jgi:CheY-like chemotaxis protein
VARAARPLKVLLAEDNAIHQRVAVGLLTKRGHSAVVASNGREALDLLARETFDIVLMDVQMPEMDGLEATAAIRRSEAGTGRHVRIVAMTAHAMAGDRDRCLSAGMDGYLSKPIDQAILHATLENEAPRAPVAASAVTYDTAAAMRQAADGQQFSHAIATFLDTCPAQLSEIKAAVDRRDAEAVRGGDARTAGRGTAPRDSHRRLAPALGRGRAGAGRPAAIRVRTGWQHGLRGVVRLSHDGATPASPVGATRLRGSVQQGVVQFGFDVGASPALFVA